MKNLKSLFYTSFIFSAFLFSSCSPDAENPVPGGADAPVITIEGDGIVDNTFTGSPGETVNATINIQAPSGFNTLYIRRFVVGTEETGAMETISRSPGSTPPLSYDHEFTYIIKQEDIENEVHYTFEAVAEKSSASTSTATLYIEATTAPAVRYTSVLLYAPLENKNSQTFFSTNTGNTYSMSQVTTTNDPISQDIDFGYFYGETMEATLAAPSTYPLDYGQATWSTRNVTRIGRTTLTDAQYNEISVNNSDAINNAYNTATFNSTNPNRASGLTAGEILAFQTDAAKTGGSKVGLIKVLSLIPGTGNTASIEIEVTVLQ
ncbi:MAG: hypothetical protein M3512_02655 [Bacteroidota bacterium]|nr:hypothetical protein [Bacteroidota bacterium]